MIRNLEQSVDVKLSGEVNMLYLFLYIAGHCREGVGEL